MIADRPAVPFPQRVDIATRFLDRIGCLDFDGAGRDLAEDAVMALPFLEDLAALQGKSAIVAQLRNTIPHMFTRMDFTYDEWYDGGGDVVIAEYHSACPKVNAGGIYRNRYITVFRFTGNKIRLYREYLNPLKIVDLVPATDNQRPSGLNS